MKDTSEGSHFEGVFECSLSFGKENSGGAEEHEETSFDYNFDELVGMTEKGIFGLFTKPSTLFTQQGEDGFGFRRFHTTPLRGSHSAKD
jgi:hypothetical protein